MALRAELEVLESISAIDRESWESLESANVFSTWGWLSTVERCSIRPVRASYLLLRQDGRAVGAAICQRALPGDQDEGLDSLMFGRAWRGLRRVGVSFLPALICSPLDGSGSPFLYVKGATADERMAIASELLGHVEAMAKAEGLAVAFMELMEDDAELIQLLGTAGYHQTRYMPLCRLDIRWSSFDDYVRDLARTSKNMRKNVQRERNRARAEGVSFERVEEIGELAPRMLELMNATYAKHGNGEFPFHAGFFGDLLMHLGKNAMIYTAWKAGKMTGVSVLVKHAGVAWGHYVGFDYASAGRDFTYFNLIFHRPIVDAIDEGARSLHYGRGQYRTKLGRGCTLCDVFVYYKPHRAVFSLPVALWCALHSRYFRRKTLR